ncbi:unnamed protein product [Lupinus luteus]|uniref:LOB domain-containing protein n=1 Tax=Lupinus luteus TaxID=3873 RepID=A0AAV1XG84_LUPLU
MSCNGCRVLRKGCSDDCMLRHSLLWIENDPQAQARATLFVAKFFGRATLMSFISSVPINQRSALFQSLVYEAVGRTINPVNGVVGLLWSGNWHLCQLGVEKVLQGGSPLNPNPHHHDEEVERVLVSYQASQEESETTTLGSSTLQVDSASHQKTQRRKLLTLFF